MKKIITFLVPPFLYSGLFVLSVGDIQNTANPDFLPYYRHALYWAQGEYSYAISGYWGPLFSWLMAPFVLLVREPTELAWYAVFFCGLLFLVASQGFFYYTLQLPRYRLAGALGTAVFTAFFATLIITPDLLMSAFLLSGYTALLVALERNSIVIAVLAGISFGASYLAKTPGIILGLAFILTVSMLLFSLKEISGRSTLRIVCSSTLALLLVTLPWIMSLSTHYETFTWSTAAQRNQQMAAGEFHENFTRFHIPRAGRVTSWEDPSEIEAATKAPQGNEFHQPSNQAFLAKLVKGVSDNSQKIYRVLSRPPWIVVILGGLIAFLLHSGQFPRFLNSPWRLGLLPASIVFSLYLLSYAGPQRYFIICFPLLFASVLGLIEWAERSDLLGWTIIKRWPKAATANLVVILFVIITILPMAKVISGNLSSKTKATGYFLAREIARRTEELGYAGPVALIGTSALGYYTAFHLNKPYYGAESNISNIRFLAQNAAKILIVDARNPTDNGLLDNPYSTDISKEFVESLPLLETYGIRLFRIMDETTATRKIQ